MIRCDNLEKETRGDSCKPTFWSMGESLPTGTSLCTLTVHDRITLALRTLLTEDRQELIDALHRHPDGDFPRICKPTNASNTLDASLPHLPSLTRQLFRLQCLVWARLGATLAANEPERSLTNNINLSLCGAATLHSVLLPHLKSRS